MRLFLIHEFPRLKILFLTAVFVFSGCQSQSEWYETFALGTVCRVKFFEKAPFNLHTTVFSRLNELEDILSANKNGSDLDKVNRNAGIMAVKVRPELIDTLSAALYFAERSVDEETGRAAFDPSIGALVKLWNIGTESEHIPGKHEIEKALSYVNWRGIEIDAAAETVFLTNPNMQLDLGAIAKGYAADEAALIVKNAGVKKAIIDLGGNIYALGGKAPQGYFTVGIQNPEQPRGVYAGVVEVKDTSLVTSGGYERFFEENGIRYHHILSTTTGYPVWNNIRSVTIIAEKSMNADALSTTVFALGYEKGIALLASIPHDGSIFIFDDGSIIASDSIKDRFKAE